MIEYLIVSGLKKIRETMINRLNTRRIAKDEGLDERIRTI